MTVWGWGGGCNRMEMLKRSAEQTVRCQKHEDVRISRISDHAGPSCFSSACSSSRSRLLETSLARVAFSFSR